MSTEALHTYWAGKLERVRSELESNNFAVWTVADMEEARSVFWNDIFARLQPASVSFGGSMTVLHSGLYEEIKDRSGLEVVDTYDTSLPLEEFVERRRRALLTDLFLTSSNAVTGDGRLVNLDGLGNRVAALSFGPKHVVLLIGRNKIVTDLEASVDRIREFAAPANAVRLERNTPCTRSMQCEDCSSPERICNVWSITEKSNPPERIKIVLINRDLGY
jgi:hypothetical protein